MKTVLINGTIHKGSTYHTARQLADKVGGELTEFFLPRDFGEFCLGCTQCFMEHESKCPHFEKLKPLTDAIDSADLIILASPVYVYHATGAMKAFLDHYGYRWMVHRPEGSIFTKQGIAITTAAGAGMKSALKDMTDSLFFWGVGRIYSYGLGVSAVNWEGVPEKKKQAIDRKTTALAKAVKAKEGRVTPAFKTRAFFFIMHLMQRNGFNERDAKYWKEHGWTEKVRPWKESK